MRIITLLATVVATAAVAIAVAAPARSLEADPPPTGPLPAAQIPGPLRPIVEPPAPPPPPDRRGARPAPTARKSGV